MAEQKGCCEKHKAKRKLREVVIHGDDEEENA